MQYTIEKIAGIECIFAPMADSNATIIEIMVRAGSNYETQTQNGISHFLEHMFFKGGKKYKTPKDVAEVVDAFGGEFNAYTGNNYAGYYVKSAPEYLPKAIDVLSDMMCDPAFPIEEMEREKGVVIQEIKMYEDNPQRLVYDKWQTYYFGDNAYGRPTIGTEANILSFTQEMLFAHKRNLYTKDNLIIVVAGKITDMDMVRNEIATKFASLPDDVLVQKPVYPGYLPTDKNGVYTK